MVLSQCIMNTSFALIPHYCEDVVIYRAWYLFPVILFIVISFLSALRRPKKRRMDCVKDVYLKESEQKVREVNGK